MMSMCDVMPTISEDNVTQRNSSFGGEDPNFEELMVSMLGERQKLMESNRDIQERLHETETRLHEVEEERNNLQKQIDANLPQVRIKFFFGSGGRHRGLYCSPLLFFNHTFFYINLIAHLVGMSARCLPYFDLNWLDVFAFLM